MTGNGTDTETVVFDTNALMMPVELDVRVFDELERLTGRPTAALDLLVPRAVVAELDRLAEGTDAAARAARVGRDLAERCRVVETEEPYADDAVLALARERDALVVTNDRPLRDRLLDEGVRAAGVRGRDTLAEIS
ncbi:MAG: PIN domain-containing protein [Haloferacaceae archaeon]